MAALAALGLLLVCAVANVPHQYYMTPAARAAQAREQTRLTLAELQTTARRLQTQNETLETQAARLAKLLESTRSDLARLTEGHNTLNTQVTASATRMQQLETAVQQANGRLAKFSESEVLRKITSERDEAAAHAQQREDQVRQLTLQLQKAGIYP